MNRMKRKKDEAVVWIGGGKKNGNSAGKRLAEPQAKSRKRQGRGGRRIEAEEAEETRKHAVITYQQSETLSQGTLQDGRTASR